MSAADRYGYDKTAQSQAVFDLDSPDFDLPRFDPPGVEAPRPVIPEPVVQHHPSARRAMREAYRQEVPDDVSALRDAPPYPATAHQALQTPQSHYETANPQQFQHSANLGQQPQIPEPPRTTLPEPRMPEQIAYETANPQQFQHSANLGQQPQIPEPPRTTLPEPRMPEQIAYEPRVVTPAAPPVLDNQLPTASAQVYQQHYPQATETAQYTPTQVPTSRPEFVQPPRQPSPQMESVSSQATVSGEVTTIREILGYALHSRASDVHLTEGMRPQMRVDGDLQVIPTSEGCLSANWFQQALHDIMSPGQVKELSEANEFDFSVTVDGIASFRVNVFRQLDSLAAAMRFISDETVPLEKLGVPAVAAELVTRPRGLVLVTGPTGSGKSTTLASMIDMVNRQLPRHIVTIEDPIEFRHSSRRSLIHQREIGSDTRSFAEAMRRVLRQDPDIILIGELRDPESIATALTAAETGHLVLSTLHTQSAAKSINRVVDAFMPEQQAQVRAQLGDALQGIITQTLLPKASGTGRVIATEVLVNTPAIANLIREGEVSQIYSMMQAGRNHGMHTLDQDLKRLVAEGAVSLETAQMIANDPASISDGLNLRSGLLEDAWLAQSGMQPDPRWNS